MYLSAMTAAFDKFSYRGNNVIKMTWCYSLTHRLIIYFF